MQWPAEIRMRIKTRERNWMRAIGDKNLRWNLCSHQFSLFDMFFFRVLIYNIIREGKITYMEYNFYGQCYLTYCVRLQTGNGPTCFCRIYILYAAFPYVIFVINILYESFCNTMLLFDILPGAMLAVIWNVTQKHTSDFKNL